MNNLMVIDGIEVRRDVYGRYSLNDLDWPPESPDNQYHLNK
nr:hypothetical protein [Escherichia coli]